MPWSSRWPPAPGDALDAEGIFGEMRTALVERNALVPADFVPGPFARWDPIRGTPAGGSPDPEPTVANFQHEIAEMLALSWPLRWWDPNRETLYTLEHLCLDAFGRPGWTVDLAETSGGQPANRWTPALAVLFGELYLAANRLDRVRILPTVGESCRRDSVYRLTFGAANWPTERAATFARFDGDDDGVEVPLAYDVGMGGDVYDDGASRHWTLESREYRTTFATAALGGCAVSAARLDFATEAAPGSADYTDTFTAEVTDGGGQTLATFASDDFGAKQVAVPAGSIDIGGDTAFLIRSTRPDEDDRPEWTPPGPNFTSTYREGLAVGGPVRLIVEVDFGHHS